MQQSAKGVGTEIKMKLFCITYAGGNAKFFSDFASYIDKFECYAIDYAGHGNRYHEKLSASFDDMVQDIASQINADLKSNEAFAVFGYSMGSIIAYECIARRLLKMSPGHLFVAAHYAPSISSIKTQYSSLTDEELLKTLSSFGGIDESLLNNRRFWPIYLPLIRNDYQLLETYPFDSVKPKLDVDISVFYSNKDTPFEYIKDWKKVTMKQIFFHEYSGTHFFLKSNGKKIAEYIMNTLQNNMITGVGNVV